MAANSEVKTRHMDRKCFKEYITVNVLQRINYTQIVQENIQMIDETSDEDLKRRLNGIISKYFESGGFKDTNETFLGECKKLGQPYSLKEAENETNENERATKLENLLRCFDEGNKDEFFKHFESLIPTSILNDNQNQDYLQLEFHLQIYFAVFLMNSTKDSNGEVNDKEKIEEARQQFKLYLENRGSALSKDSNFLPYFALPFIDDPTLHITFTELFQESWIKSVRNELEMFLVKTIGSPKPTLSTYNFDLASIYKRHQNYDQLEQLLIDSQNQLTLKNDDLIKLQVNYRNLMRVTVELLSALEVMVKGDDVNLTNVIDVCLNAFPDLFPSSTQLNNSYDQDRVSIETDSVTLSEKSLSDKNHNFTILHSKSYDWNLVALDYKKIKQDLVSGPLRLKIFILQALRWRLTRSPPGAQRKSVLLDYIVNDLFGVQGGIYNSSISQLIMSPNNDLRQTMLRLLNSFASLAIGRSYLAQKSGIVSAVMDSVLFNKLEPLSLDMTLACLQKLSLRRELQTAMIQRDLIEKLIYYLDSIDNDLFTDYSLEYSVALLMNLSLRSAGKSRCAKQPQKVLKVLTNLLGSQNQDIIPYVNGTMYSLLTDPGIRKEAIKMGLEGMLISFMQESSAEIKRQFEFILKQLTTENPVENTISDFEDEDEDDEENDVLEEELDMGDTMEIVPGELQGELLFTTYYFLLSVKGNSKQSEELSVQSVTPRSLDQKTIGSPQTWLPHQLTETDSIEDSLGSTIWYPQPVTSVDTGTVDSSPKSPLLDHYATHVMTKVIGIEKPLSEAVEFPPILPREPEKYGKSVNEYIVAFSSRPKIRRTPESSPRHQSRRLIKREQASPSQN